VATANLRVGTSSWSEDDWRGPFYPPDARPREFLTHYSRVFDTVECDATFYAVPSVRTVEGWRERTPDGFLLSSKLPREITHERGMVDCQDVTRGFLAVMDRLGDRLGPIVAQFAYVAKGRDPQEYETGEDFRARLSSFLAEWPQEKELAVEVRNAKWIAPPLIDLLRERRVALVVSVYYTMPGPERFLAGPDPWTTDLTYVRFLGHHRKMDELIARLRREGKRSGDWNELAVDRTTEMRRWVEPLRERAEHGSRVLAYFNNHYAGYAPGSAERFVRLWTERAGQGR
jgi:uncharacterized protein YecE (DUF72 family)